MKNRHIFPVFYIWISAEKGISQTHMFWSVVHFQNWNQLLNSQIYTSPRNTGIPLIAYWYNHGSTWASLFVEIIFREKTQFIVRPLKMCQICFPDQSITNVILLTIYTIYRYLKKHIQQYSFHGMIKATCSWPNIIMLSLKTISCFVINLKLKIAILVLMFLILTCS